MQKLTHEDLYTLEAYDRHRPEFRARVMEHKQHRRLLLGEHVILLFEDRLTMQYQIQEMLRVEKIFSVDGILEELEAYNPLIPDGMNWKATMMIEYADPEERREALEKLVGIENRVWARAEGHDHVFAVADEDLDRTTDSKTSSVHFLRFELPADVIAALKAGDSLEFGISHEQYDLEVTVPEPMRESLIADLA